jgi:hypothetical protein
MMTLGQGMVARAELRMSRMKSKSSVREYYAHLQKLYRLWTWYANVQERMNEWTEGLAKAGSASILGMRDLHQVHRLVSQSSRDVG